MDKIKYHKSLNVLFGEPLGDFNYWVDKNLIPIGTLHPYESYNNKIPDEDIVTIPFDPLDTPLTKRRAMNILILGGSGDGKSIMGKQIWSILHEAGYYCIYVDPKSTDSGRAQKPWESKRMAPYMKPKGIPLKHYLPVWATNNYQHMIHNFENNIYSARLENIDEREMWQGLGMTEIAASRVTKIIRDNRREINFDLLKMKLSMLNTDELPGQTLNNVMRTLADLEYFEMVNENYSELDMLKVWKKKPTKDSKTGTSICISYNNASKIQMTFDIGHKINQSAKYYHLRNNQVPIMWFLDDSSYYADNFKEVSFNFAVYEIRNIGYNYRSLGVYNILAVQSLAIIDEGVAESYRMKIISPLFQGVDQLSKINLPKKAVQYLKEGLLVKDKARHLMQYLLIDENNEVIPFFPFTPPCNHFTEIYFPQQKTGQTRAGA